jgi:energy-coupling factor transporter transmembrane protein EcfT
MRAVKLRSGLTAGHPIRAMRATTRALGGLLLYSFDLAQRDYDVMRLRGYQGHLRIGRQPRLSPRTDTALVTGCLSALATSVLWRFEAFALNPYSWIVPLVPLAALLTASALRWRNQ